MPIVETLAIAGSIAAIISAFKDGLSLLKKWRNKSRATPEDTEQVSNVERSLQGGPRRIASQYERSYKALGIPFAQGDVTAYRSLIDTLVHLNKALLECLRSSPGDVVRRNLGVFLGSSEDSCQAVESTLRDLHQRLIVAAPIQRTLVPAFMTRDYRTSAPLPPATYPSTVEPLLIAFSDLANQRIDLIPLPSNPTSISKIDELRTILEGLDISRISRPSVIVPSDLVSQNIVNQNLRELQSLSSAVEQSHFEIYTLKGAYHEPAVGQGKQDSARSNPFRAPSIHEPSQQKSPEARLLASSRRHVALVKVIPPSSSEVASASNEPVSERLSEARNPSPTLCPNSRLLQLHPNLSSYPLIKPNDGVISICQECSLSIPVRSTLITLFGKSFTLTGRYLAKYHMRLSCEASSSPNWGKPLQAPLACPRCYEVFKSHNIWALHIEVGHSDCLDGWTPLFEGDDDVILETLVQE